MDLVSHFQASIQSSYVKHIASSDLHILHSEFSFLYKEGNIPSKGSDRSREMRCPARAQSYSRKGVRAEVVCGIWESKMSPGRAQLKEVPTSA